MLEGFRERKLDVTVALQELSDIAGGLGAKSLKERARAGPREEARGGSLPPRRRRRVQPRQIELRERAPRRDRAARRRDADHGRDPPPEVRRDARARRSSTRRADARASRSATRASSRSAAARPPDEVDYLEVGYPAAAPQGAHPPRRHPRRERPLAPARGHHLQLHPARRRRALPARRRANPEGERAQLPQDKLLKASRDKIVFVITKWDILNDDEKKEALAYARTQLANLVKDPVVFPISAETALAGRQPAESGMPELLAHLTTFLAEERGRILLDNALGEGLNVADLLAQGCRRAAPLARHEDRRARATHQDARGGPRGRTRARSSSAASKIREEISGIKVGAQKDLERFVEETIRQLPNVIDSAKREDLRKFLPAFLEDTFQQWAEAEAKEIGGKLEAARREDHRARSRRTRTTPRSASRRPSGTT